MQKSKLNENDLMDKRSLSSAVSELRAEAFGHFKLKESPKESQRVLHLYCIDIKKTL